MKKFFLALTVAASIQAAPAITVIKTGWEKVSDRVYVYYGTKKLKLRDEVESTKPVAVVRVSGAYWVYQFEGKPVVPTANRKAGEKAVEQIYDRD